MKTEILDGHSASSDLLDCPISIITAGWNSNQPLSTSQPSTNSEAKHTEHPSDKQEKIEKDISVDLPIYEIIDSSDESTATREPCSEKNTTTARAEIKDLLSFTEKSFTLILYIAKTTSQEQPQIRSRSKVTINQVRTIQLPLSSLFPQQISQ